MVHLGQEKANINQQDESAEGTGVVTAGIIFLQDDASSSLVQNVETWDGSSWSEVSDLNTGRRSLTCGTWCLYSSD